MARGGRSPLVQPNTQLQNQTAADRRQLRGSYRELHAQALADKENIVNGSSDLQDLLAKADALHSKAERPREHAVDAEVFAQLTQCGLAMIKNCGALNNGRLPATLVRALRSMFLADPMAAHNSPALGPEDFDWAGVGAGVAAAYRTSTGMGCMLGPLEAQAKARKPIVRQRRQAVEELTRPAEVEAIQEGDKQETDRNYENMWRQLRSAVGVGQRVPLINLVCNHRSFAQTVENIFTLSFLVRDQRVRLDSDAELGLMVQPVSEEQKAAAAQQGQGKALQFMMSFTMREWDMMKQLVPASNCIMQHRGTAAAAAAGGGGGGSAQQRG